MGRLLGAHDGDNDLDRPDLNKCPECGCYFAQLNCPLCGKICPDELRAGNRKEVKKKKKRSSGSGRSYFVEWYHSWWCIILALIVAPVIGIVLLFTSPHKRSHKIICAVVMVALWFVSTFGIGFLSGIGDLLHKPVDTSLSQEEYIAVCETVTPESYYRSAAGYNDQFVTLTLIVDEKITTGEGKYDTYYVCRDADSKFEILVRDCMQDDAKNFIVGDVITVYGEGAGECTVYDMDYYVFHTAPCIHAAFIALH